MDSAPPLNRSLFRIHRLFCIAFVAFAAITILIGLSWSFGGEGGGFGLVWIGLTPLAVAHWYAAKGAKLGKTYGKVLTRIIATIWLIGFPVGTILGIYSWSQTFSKWRGAP